MLLLFNICIKILQFQGFITIFALVYIIYSMGLKSILAKPYAKILSNKIERDSNSAIKDQEDIRKKLIEKAKNTVFGQDHNFKNIRTYEDFKKNIPIRDYEELSSYIKKLRKNESDILWPGLPAYFAKTSGTTSGAKFIPITKDSISNHINGAKYALLNYIHETGNSKFTDGKMIFLSGSPELEKEGDILTGRLSGIVNHHVPGYLRTNQLPSYETNCIEDWEEKLAKIIDETEYENMTLISGIPPWIQMYFDWLIERHPGKKIKDIFPNLSIIVYGGVNFEPYRKKLFESIGKEIDTVETYPASEGFFAYQDKQKDNGLLLNTNSGIFFEFVPLEEFFEDNPRRISLKDVELGVNYALIINSNAGLWGYSIGDTIKFIDKNPYRILVTGRVKHFISAFGEHVIGEEVEKAMNKTLEKHPAIITEFTVAPYVETPEGILPHHEWYIEFVEEPENLDAFAASLDKELRALNEYYDDLIGGSILSPLKIKLLEAKAFQNYMKSLGKLGGQNKAPRLSNDRKVAEVLQKFLLK